MKDFEIIQYTKNDGSIPVKDFILSLSPKMQAKILMQIDLLEEYGNELRGIYIEVIIWKERNHNEME